MKIGLLDLGRKKQGKIFPNFALMKISAYHKSIGNHVEWYNQCEAEIEQYDVVYVSKIFSFVPDYSYFIKAKKVIYGGTGYYLNRVLPKAIKNCLPDYSIYPEVDYAIGFLTRGCVNNCYFCCVPKKEGELRPYDSWQRIKRPDSKEIIFMDNNVLASEYGIRQMQSMVGQDIRIDFNQGMDCIRVDERTAKIMAGLNWLRFIRFSCDKEYQMPYIEKAVNLLERHGNRAEIFVYVLGTTMESTEKRVEFLRELQVKPFVQPYREIGSNKPVDKEIQAYARYVNMTAVFKTVSWHEYKANIWKRVGESNETVDAFKPMQRDRRD